MELICGIMEATPPGEYKVRRFSEGLKLLHPKRRGVFFHEREHWAQIYFRNIMANE